MICAGCGASIPLKGAVCPNCGRPLQTESVAAETREQRTVAPDSVLLPYLPDHQLRGDPMAHQHPSMHDCIAACQSCHDVCLETINHCLKMGGKHAEAEHIRTLMDCVQICETSADFMRRGSQLHVHTCAACAAVCERCAVSCDKLDGAEMKQCADECRRCAAKCREMSQAVA